MYRIVILTLSLLSSFTLHSQTNVRAWYADGQVWVVWNIQLPIPETVNIYVAEESFTTVASASKVGKPFHLDYLPTALKEQVDTNATFRIPDGLGGIYQLGFSEGLFVYTPHTTGSLFFAVAEDGDFTITANQITDEPVPFIMDPVGDPVECHLQAVFPSPFNEPDYRCLAYMMWVDGRNDLISRPDFPVMANTAKNGMPGFFLMSVPLDLDTTQPVPLSVWLHGGGGTARQSLVGSRQIVNISPNEGILVSHNDDVYGYRGSTPPFIENPSLHFGWRKYWDPFTSDNIPTQPDTIINYTHRRYLWIDEWLIRTFNVDPARIHIHGHSMGSWGATSLIKAYPEHYASAVIFNNGFRGHDAGGSIAAMFGEPSDHYPTNLRNRKGENVHYPYILDLTTNTSPHRDIPFLRSFHSKNDVGNANFWGANVVNNYEDADSIGHGMALLWSERAHGIDTGPDYNDHWVNGNTSETQTVTDDVAWAESHYRADVSYPAFYNHRLDTQSLHPGDGTIGTGPNGVGDDWGSWGGWHRWDLASITDEPNKWSVEAWLESSAVFANDNSPYNSLTSDLAIRRPVNFKPKTGELIYWRTEDAITKAQIQSGTETVLNDDLVSIPDVMVYREDIFKVRIIISTEPVATHELEQAELFSIFPNPVEDKLAIELPADISGECNVKIFSADQKLVQTIQLYKGAGRRWFEVDLNDNLLPGMYVVEVVVDGVAERKLFVKR